VDEDDQKDEAKLVGGSPEVGGGEERRGRAVLSAGVSASCVRERKRRGKKRW
jgi:hypothetical protein